MKKLLGLVLVFATCVSIVGCGKTAISTTPPPTECNHQYSEATCLEPAKCKLCNEVSGAALGHSTDFGKCRSCGEKINYQLILDIERHINNASDYVEKANVECEKIATATSLSQYDVIYIRMATYYGKAKEEFKRAYDLCGSESELRDLKSYLKDAMDSAPDRWTGSTSSKTDLVNYLEEAKNCIFWNGTCGLECLRIKESFG